MYAKRANEHGRGGYEIYGLGCMFSLVAIAGCGIPVEGPTFVPTANAGPDLQREVGEQVDLSGLASTDPDGDTLTFLWRQVSGPSISMSGQHSLSMTFVPPSDGIYEFELTVTDNTGGSDTDLVRVFVGHDLEPEGAPAANAGLDQTVNAGAYVVLDPSNSRDPNGLDLYAEWEALTPSSPYVGLGSNGSAFFTAPATTMDLVLEFRLTITNDNGLSGTDTVVITIRGSSDTINPAGRCTSTSCPFGQSCDSTTGRCIMIDPEECVEDADCGDGTYCNGVELCIDGVCAVGDRPCAANETCDETYDKCYTDDNCATSADCATGYRCEVYSGKCAASKVPTANAGMNLTSEEGEQVTLGGTGSDPDYDAVTYMWEQTKGTTVTITNPESSYAYFTAPSVTAETVLEFKLTVTDATGLSASDSVLVTVTDASGGEVAQIAIAPATLTPAFQVGQMPAAQSFSVRNSGKGKLLYAINILYETGMGWITLNYAAGESTGEVDTINVTYKGEGLAAGIYKAKIVVSDPAAENKEASVAVTMTVLGSTEYLPTIELDAYEFKVAGNGSGGAARDPITFRVRNRGNDILYYELAADQPWIQFEPSSGETGGDWQTIKVHLAGAEHLPVGEFTATISVSDPLATNSPQTIPVTIKHVMYFEENLLDANQVIRDPQKLAIDADGNLYVACGTTHTVRKFFPGEDLLLTLGTSKNTVDGQFDTPSGVAVDAQGNIYVSELGNNRIQKFDSAGNFLLKWGIRGAGVRQFNNPRDIAVDSFGNLYVADTSNNRIQKFDGNGAFLAQWETKVDYAQSPNGLFIDSANRLFVAMNAGINEYAIDGTLVRTVDKTLSGCQDLVTDGADALYVISTGSPSLHKLIFSNGVRDGDWSFAGAGLGQHQAPWYYENSIIRAANDYYYTTDPGNNRILKWSPM